MQLVYLGLKNMQINHIDFCAVCNSCFSCCLFHEREKRPTVTKIYGCTIFFFCEKKLEIKISASSLYDEERETSSKSMRYLFKLKWKLVGEKEVLQKLRAFFFMCPFRPDNLFFSVM